MLVGVPERNSDIIIEGHVPESGAGLFDQLAAFCVTADGAGKQRKHSPFHQILPVLLMLQAAVTYCAKANRRNGGVFSILV